MRILLKVLHSYWIPQYWSQQRVNTLCKQWMWMYRADQLSSIHSYRNIKVLFLLLGFCYLLRVNQNLCVVLCVLFKCIVTNPNVAILTILSLYEALYFFGFPCINQFNIFLRYLNFCCSCMRAGRNKVQVLLKPQMDVQRRL